MRAVWAPRRPPPAPGSVSGLSAEAEIVWRAIQEKFRQRELRETKHDPKHYYRSMYTRKFGDTSHLYSSQPSTSMNRQHGPHYEGHDEARVSEHGNLQSTPQKHSGTGPSYGPVETPSSQWMREPSSADLRSRQNTLGNYSSGGFKAPELPWHRNRANIVPVDNVRDMNITTATENAATFTQMGPTNQQDQPPETTPHDESLDRKDPCRELKTGSVLQPELDMHDYIEGSEPLDSGDFILRCSAYTVPDEDASHLERTEIQVFRNEFSKDSGITETSESENHMRRSPSNVDYFPASQEPLFDPTQMSQGSHIGTQESPMSCSPPLDLSQDSFQMEWQKACKMESKFATEVVSSDNYENFKETHTFVGIPTSAQQGKNTAVPATVPEDLVHRLKITPEPPVADEAPEYNEPDSNGDTAPLYSDQPSLGRAADGGNRTDIGHAADGEAAVGISGNHTRDTFQLTPNPPSETKQPPSALTKRLREINRDHPNKKLRTVEESPVHDIEIHEKAASRAVQQLKKEKDMEESPYTGCDGIDKPVKKTEKHRRNKENGQFLLKMKPVFKAPSKPKGSVTHGKPSLPCDRLLDISHLQTPDLATWQQRLCQASEIAVTLVYGDNTTQLSPNRAMVMGIAVAFPVSLEGPGQPSSLQYMFMPHALEKGSECFKWARDALRGLVSGKAKILGFRLQDLLVEVMKHYDVTHVQVSSGKLDLVDSAIAAWLIDPDNPPATFSDCFKLTYGLKQKSTDSGWKSQLCDDLSVVGPLMMQLSNQLRKKDLWDIFTALEMPLCPLLAAMDLTGLQVEGKKLHRAGERLKRKLRQLEKAAHQAAGRSFLVNSHVQLREVLFEELKLDQQLMTKARIAKTSIGKQKSTSEAVLQQLTGTHRLPGIILEHRQLQKLLSTYVEGMLGHVRSGELFTHWDQTAAATGRLTSTNPNIQSIPKQPVTLAKIQPTLSQPGTSADEDIYARDAFVSREGHVLMAADFQQIELRILAHLSGDPCILSVFNSPNNQDIFVELTSQWLGKCPSEVSSADREQTKRIVYSVMYGAGKERLAEYLKIATEEARNIMDSFLVRFPGINAFSRRCIDEARTKGYLCTLFRRRRLFPNIRHPNPPLRAYSERQAVNFCVQGSAADLCKAAMLQVERALRVGDLNTKLQAQIHDELLLEVPEKEVHTVAGLLVSIMESGPGLCGPKVQFRVPLKVSVCIGTSWAYMDKYDPGWAPGIRPVNEV